MPTNQQRRATAKRKLERQLERRAKQAKRRRILTIAGGAVAAVAVIAAVVVAVVVSKDDHKGTTRRRPEHASSSARDHSPPPEPLGHAAPLPPFKPSANVGANCQYPPSPDKAAKPVKPPRTGKVPTDPAQVSVSMVTSQGNMGLLLANNESPCTVNSFASLANQKYFNDTKCHRLTTSPSLSVSCNVATRRATAPAVRATSSATNTPPTSTRPMTRSAQSRFSIHAARWPWPTPDPNTNGSQFFMVYKDSELPPQYTVFGTIQADGLATLDKIAKAGVAGGGEDGPPASEVIITSMLLD